MDEINENKFINLRYMFIFDFFMYSFTFSYFSNEIGKIVRKIASEFNFDTKEII